MMTWISALLAAGIALYVQLHLAKFIRKPLALFVTRALLLVLGTTVGVMLPHLMHADGLPGLLVGLGLVHAPAGAILLLKGWRGEGRS